MKSKSTKYEKKEEKLWTMEKKKRTKQQNINMCVCVCVFKRV